MYNADHVVYLSMAKRNLMSNNYTDKIILCYISDGKIPRDSTLVIDRELVIPPSLYITMCVFAFLGIVLATFFFIFNILYRENRYSTNLT